MSWTSWQASLLLPLTHGVNWNELGRNYRCFRQQGIEISIYDLLDCPTDEEQVTLLMLLDYSNIVYNMTFEDTRRTNFVLSELLIWTKYLHYDLQRMYEVADEIDQEKEALKEDVSRSPQRAAVAVTTTSGRSEHSG